ncbi:MULTISPECIES: hypothetical protein [unclassified Okeania]|nr:MULTISPECIES: hypothetical protein [unclassified Okeania]NET22612.1 hypothetical protein [Okeania sp. SIO1H5]NET95763.1 hypothetical protein [Okeania sp. SIO1H2]
MLKKVFLLFVGDRRQETGGTGNLEEIGVRIVPILFCPTMSLKYAPFLA